MAAMTNYLENALVNHVLRNTAYTSPTTIYVALYTTGPTETTSGTEVSGTGYARQSASFNAPTDGATTNSADISFPIAESDWGTITDVGLFDASTGGNLLFYGPFDVQKSIFTGDQFIIRQGDLDITLD